MELSPTLQAIYEAASSANVLLTRFLYCDNSGLIRGKAVCQQDLPLRLRTGVGLPLAQQAVTAWDELASVEGMGPVGECRLLPDPATFVLAPYAPCTAIVLGNLHTLSGERWSACPRSFLERMRERLARHHLEARVGTEHEFTLLASKDEHCVPADYGPLLGTEGLHVHADFLLTLLQALQQQQMQPALVHTEYGPGQMEVSLHPVEALAAADHLCLFRETLRGVASRMGLVASLAPKPFVDQFAGNGLHLHLSLWGMQGSEQAGHNLFADVQQSGMLSETGRYFIGGVLAHLPGLLALTCASVNSYARLQPQHWSGASLCWGLDNREAAIRVPSISWGQETESLRLELRCADHSANPYLALGGLIAAGLDGLEQQLPPGEPLQLDPSALSEEERRRLGIHPLPTTLAEALSALERDPVLISALGPRLSTSYLAVKRQEVAYCQQRTPRDIARAHLTRY